MKKTLLNQTLTIPCHENAISGNWPFEWVVVSITLFPFKILGRNKRFYAPNKINISLQDTNG